ncbi:MAG: putative Ig domain-containing protein [Sphingobacteriales bacterium]
MRRYLPFFIVALVSKASVKGTGILRYSAPAANSYKAFLQKSIVFALAFIVISLSSFNAAFASKKKVTGVTYGGQTGAANGGTGTSVTYTINLNEGSSFFGSTSSDDILLSWTSGTPTGVTWSFTSATQGVTGGTTTTPSFTPTGSNSTITFTVTTTGATPAGTYPFTIQITDNNFGGGPYNSGTMNLVVNAVSPTISYTGSPFTYYTGQTIASLTPTVTNSPTSYSISPALPAGLVFNTGTGVISGTPTATSAATTYTITAMNASGSGNTTISIIVLASTISYTGSPYTFYNGTAIATLSPTEVGGNPTTYGISPALPAGLSINTSTGDITGTPTATSATAAYTVTATYTGGVTATTSINITVLAPTISYAGSPFTYVVGTAISTLTPTVTGTPAGYSISPAISAGLSFSTATGVISGTPTATATATTYTITANYAGGITATTTINVTVNPAKPVISYSPSVNVYILNTAIGALSPANTGGTATSWAISPGLPAGLSFSTTTGVISGTPTALSAATTYTITATNVTGNGTTTVNLTVNPLPPVISYTPSNNVYVVANAIPSLTPASTGGVVVSYAISPGLPSGLSFNTATGVISGTPSAASAATTYTITATNTGGTGSTTVTLEVDALPPSISYTPATNTYFVGIAITTLTPTVLTGNPTSYSINAPLPAGLSFNTSTGAITGTPTAVTAATTYTITASNTGGSGSTTEKITIVNPPAPVISYSPSTNTYVTGTAISTLTPTNTGGTPTGGYSISTALPAGLSFNTATGVISGTPTAVSSTTIYTISATNAGGTGNTTVTLTVNPQLPAISYSPSTNIYSVGLAIASLTPTSTGGAVASYSISPGLPTGLSFNTSTGVISGTPTVVSTATTYTITATNVTGSATTTVNLTVNPLPPVISYTPSTNTYTVGTAITALTPTNTGGPVVSYTISPALSAGLSFSTTTGVISGTPTIDVSVITYTITATNAGGSGSTTVNITVYPAPPVISYTPSTNVYTVGSAITTLTPANTGGVTTNWVIGPSLPPGLSFNGITGAISGTPLSTSPVTTYTISADNAGGLSTTTVTISCINPTPPVISYTPSTNTYTVGTAISSLTPANTGGPATSWSIGTALPAGLSFDTTTGIISGTPTAVTATATYTITATNSAGTGSTTVTLTVNPSGPIISYTPSTNAFSVGSTITSLTPTNTGGTPTSYSISSALPAGLSFSTTTGVISGTPTATSASTIYTITATNGTGSTTTTVTISVNNTAPNISYSPGTVSYSVGTAITAATPNNTGGAASTWAITAGGSMPAGLTFNTSTGVISGTPTAVFPTTTFTIKATNGSGNSSTNLIITVSPHAPIISYTPSTVALTLNASMTTMTPTNTGGAVTGYSYSSTGVSLTGASLSGPSLMTIDASGNIYVANYNNGTISKWNSSHTYIGKYTTGKAMSNPEGIVFDSAGNSYVEDTGAGAIYKFGPTGTYISTIITGLNHPLGISIDPSDNLYIATYVYSSPYTSSVTKYSTSGVLEQTISNTQMDESDGVTVDGSGNIYVLNRAQDQAGTNKGYVTKYNSAGVYQSTFSSGYEDPLAISVDPSGDVFVADSHNNQVKIYSSNGVLLNTINGFNDVEGFVADGNGNLYVSDYSNNTVKEFAAQGGYYISAPLPAGLSFSTTTGQITGTPTVTFAATTYTITAYNITGSGTTTVTLSCIQSNDWIGATSTDWNTASNWLSNAVPTNAQSALIGVNRTFNFFPTVLTADGTVNVGSIQIGNLGGQTGGVIVNTGGTLNVLGALTYQSDASSGLGYTATLSGAGTINANSISVISNTTLGSSYNTILAISVSNLNVTTNVALTSSNSGAALFNSKFNITGGTTLITGLLQTTNTASSTSSFVVVPTTTATLQLSNTAALSGLSSTGTNVVTFNNTGTTVEYSGAAQTVYTSAAITGLSGGVSYQNITFSGTGIKTASSAYLNVSANFTNTMANDGSNYIDLSSPTVYFNGTTQSLAGGAGNGTTFYNVYFGGLGTKTMTSGGFNVASSGVLTMIGGSSSTILATGGFLTLNSDATGSASVAAISGPVISGNVNVQRYLTGGVGYRSYRLGSSPIYAGTVSSNNIYSINYLQNSMYLTGSGGGFDKAGNPTIYLYREDQAPSNASFISGNYWGVNSINNSPAYNYGVSGLGGSGTYSIPVGNGYLFFFRGNRASASLATETTTAYTNPVAATMTTTGPLTQGQVIVHSWYTPSSVYVGFSGSGAGTNFAVRGFNLVGNPYASSIDWESFTYASTTYGIYGINCSSTAYELNDLTGNYDTYQKGGAYTNHGRRTIVSGQGFFVLATNTTSQIIFNESAKSTIQNTGANLFLATNITVPATDEHLRLQMAMDSINTDDVYIGFDPSYSTKAVGNEDALYKPGNGKVSLASFTSDNIPMAINKMPLGQAQTVIPLSVKAREIGIFHLNMTELNDIPQIYGIWLVDSYKNDSLDMRHNSTYAFNITADTNSQGTKRFKLILRQDPTLAVHLLNFTGAKATNGNKLNWVTENESTYTNFTLERSTDGGATYNALEGFTSNSLGSYSFLDTAPETANMYRLKMVDLNGTVTYSNIVTMLYANNNSSIVKNNIMLYPNPAQSTINLTINAVNPTSANPAVGSESNAAFATGTGYTIKIMNSAGVVVRTTTTTQQTWQTNVNALLPGTYIMQVVKNSDNSLVGKGAFVKL